MKRFFFLLMISFGVLLVINLGWFLLILYTIISHGIQFLLQGENFFTSVYRSVLLKWIILADGIWLTFAIIYVVSRKQYKTDSNRHYLQYHPMDKPSICVIIPAYNEELSIEKVVNDYLNQEFVDHVIVIDNHSVDKTPILAERCGATVVRKNENRGYAHSYVMGLKEALKTNSNVIVTTEADGTFNAYDIKKMLPYLDNCDMVIGTRQVQVLTEKGNQNSIMHVWGNTMLAKLIQFKYLSLQHLGITNLSDVGCLFRSIRREALEKNIENLCYPGTDDVIGGVAFSIHITMLAIENDLRVIEIPVTFNKRIGKSKNRSDERLKGIKYGLIFLWFILTK